MNNKIIGDIEYKNAEITFKGDNNIFICDKLTLENCKIRFTGSNSIIYISGKQHSISLNMRISNDSVIYIGKNAYINRTSDLYATERKNIIIGNELLLSFDVCFRTADPHTIYDCDTLKRINPSKSILIGDRVWIGQEALILKGTTIGSGSIIGGHSVVSNKNIASNNLYAGNPAKKIKENVFYGSQVSTHDYTLDDEENSMETDISYKYELDDATVSLKDIDEELMNLNNVDDKIKCIQEKLVNNNHKNRFYIG